MRKPRPESFEKFYYAKVGLGEGCGCAERVIDVYEFNRQASERHAPRQKSDIHGALKRLARKLGLSVVRD
ncbi:MAG: hypothetical protein AB3N20_12745 [Rhizobiaceae bacterium]